MSSLVNLVCLNCRRGGYYEMQYIPRSLVTASELLSRQPSTRQAARGLDFQETSTVACTRAWAAPAG